MNKITKYLALLLLSVVLCQNVSAKAIDFDLLAVTPEGSWQVREDITTDHKGKQTASTIRMSMVGSEMRNGEKHRWIEMAMDSYKISKKGKRKKTGDRVVTKSLLSEARLKSDPDNIMSNLAGLAVETIIQNGKDDPIRMNKSGGMMAGMMKAMQTEISYDYKQLGKEKVNVQAGEFNADKIQGNGSVDMKVLFKKIRVESDSIMWVSSSVPFGTVKIESTTLTNGKESKTTSELLEYGKSGATSEITKEPVEMPSIPNILGS